MASLLSLAHALCRDFSERSLQVVPFVMIAIEHILIYYVMSFRCRNRIPEVLRVLISN